MNIALDTLVHTWSGWAFASVVLVVGWSLAALFVYVALRLVMAYNAHHYPEVRQRFRDEYEAQLTKRGRQGDLDDTIVLYSELLEERERNQQRMN